MERQKLFYTINEITENLYTNGSEFQLESGEAYVGLYHRYTTGEIFTEPAWNPGISKKLEILLVIPEQTKIYKKNNPNIKTKFNSITRYFPEVKDTDIQKKYIVRYFLYKLNERSAIEINQTQFNSWQSNELDNNLYAAIKINWYISGEPFDITQNGTVRKGVITKNQKTITQTNLQYPGFNQTVNNPYELYVDTTVTVPPSINPTN